MTEPYTNSKRFNELVDTMIAEEKECMKCKGAEYTISSDDRLANFKAIAKEIDVPLLKVWYVYAYKHWASISNYVKVGEIKSTEPIEGRIMDLRNYLALGRAIIEEERHITENDFQGD